MDAAGRGPARPPVVPGGPGPGRTDGRRRLVGARRPAQLIPWWASVALVLAAVPFVRPNILGELGLSPVGFAMLVTAGIAAVVRRTADPSCRPRGGGGFPYPAATLIVCVGLGLLWPLLRDVAFQPSAVSQQIQGVLVTVGSMLAIFVVCAEPRARVAVARGFVILVAVFSASYVVTALIWTLGGVGSGQIGTFPVGDYGAQPLYFPFTPTVSEQVVFGTVLPRFTGLGREPGWMSMYCAVAFFLTDARGVGGRKLKPFLLAGLVGCLSTAGFGVFVVAWAYQRFLRDRGEISMANYLRQLLGLGAIALAVWLAISAPVLGLSDKNDTSFNAREAATDAGVRALYDNPWGGDYDIPDGGINLISDIAVAGLPYVLLVCVGLLQAVIRSGPRHPGNVIILVILVTLIASQPSRDSAWAFGLVVLACAFGRSGPADLERSPHTRLGGGRGSRTANARVVPSRRSR